MEEYKIPEYKDYFEFWKDNSEHVCECCVHNFNFPCDDCEDFYKLTEEDCKNIGLSVDPDAIWYPKEGWNCQNVGNYNLCKKFQNTPCASCLFEYEEGNVMPNFESNGKIL